MPTQTFWMVAPTLTLSTAARGLTIFSAARAMTCSMAARATTSFKEVRVTTPTSSTVPMSIPIPSTKSVRSKMVARIPSSARFLTGFQILWRFSTSQVPLQSMVTEILRIIPLQATARQTASMARKATTFWMAAWAQIRSSAAWAMTPTSLTMRRM